MHNYIMLYMHAYVHTKYIHRLCIVHLCTCIENSLSGGGSDNACPIVISIHFLHYYEYSLLLPLTTDRLVV